MRHFLPFFILLISMSVFAQLNYTTSWIGNSFSGKSQWVLQDITDIHVTPDGTVFTNVFWDENGGEVTQFKDGKFIKTATWTHGWGYHGGDAITANSNYVYFAYFVENEGGGLQDPNKWPPKGYDWICVNRRFLSNIQKNAPWDGGLGGATKGNYLLIHEIKNGTNGAGVSGLAADDSLLFVSCPLDDKIRVYNAETMQPVRDWSLTNPGRLTLDSEGMLWAVSGQNIIRFDHGGKKLDEIAIDRSILPYDIDATTDNRLFISDRGQNQNIQIYKNITTKPTFDATFGHQYGIYAGPVFGAFGDLRFNNPMGVGVDEAGHIYVASSSSSAGETGGGGGVVLESYTGAGVLNWRLFGLEFIDCAAADPESEMDVYTKEEHFIVDYSKPAGEQWTYKGYTVDKYKYPDDPRLHNWSAAAKVQRIQGELFLFVNAMHMETLFQCYRFSPETDGEIAIPSSFFAAGPYTKPDGWPTGQPSSGEYIWRDGNGDGAFQANEYLSQNANAPTIWGWFVDSDGTVWQATQTKGIRKFPLQGLDEHGNPIWTFDSMEIIETPAPINRLERIHYNAKTDVMTLVGYTPENPHHDGMWKIMGREVVRYDNWSKGNRVARLRIVPDYKVSNDGVTKPASVAVTDDFIFVVYVMEERVNVYSAKTGLKVGEMSPLKDLGDCGWVDIPEGIEAFQRDNGEYVIFVEEDAKSKIIMYQWDAGGVDIGVAPEINIISPSADSIYTMPATFVVRATASTGVTKVEFFADGLKLGEDANGADGWSIGWENVTPGKHTLIARASDSNGLTNTSNMITVEVTVADGPFFGYPLPLPGHIEAENFDGGGEGVAYHDVDPENKGGDYRSEGVDIQKCTDLNGGYAVFDIQDGEWLAYTVKVDCTALYRLKVRLAVENDGGAFLMKLNDKDITGTITIPPTMGPALWNTVTLDSLELAGGEARFVFEAVTGGFQLNYIDVLSAGTGSITREWWDGVSGTTISDIPTDQRPTGTNELSLFECPTDWSDDYAQRVRGYLYPQTSGDYTFWIASDDASELWLSTDDAPNNKVKLCGVSGWTPSRAWDQNAEQKSAKIKLTAGHKYYIEALHKEGSGGDNLAVAWSGPDIKRDVIAGQYLAPYEDKFCDLVLVDFVPTYVSTENQYQFTFTVTNASSIATPKEIPFTVHIMLGDKVICGSDLYYTDISGWTTFTGVIHDGVELQDGVHELTAVVDIDNDISETDEANNYKSKMVMVGFRLPENPEDVVKGMYYEYFLGAWSELPDFDTLTPTATGVVDNFDISPRTRDDNFAFRFLGYVQVPDDGEYTFYTASDDGSKLYIGDIEVVNNDGAHGVEEKSGSIPLKAGKHAITVTFFEAGGGQDLFVSYKGPSISKQNIPDDVLYVNKVLAAVESERVLLPHDYKLYPNTPNPFNPTTRITFDMPKAAHVSVGIYNVIGQRVCLLVDDSRDAGQYNLTWNGLNDTGHQVTSGVYVIRLHSENVVLTQKMVLVR